MYKALIFTFVLIMGANTVSAFPFRNAEPIKEHDPSILKQLDENGFDIVCLDGNRLPPAAAADMKTKIGNLGPGYIVSALVKYSDPGQQYCVTISKVH